MIRVQAASRLHFGLLSLDAADPSLWLPLPPRYFGGVGLMIEDPGIELTVAPASAWSAAGPCAERALGFAQAFCHYLSIDKFFRIEIQRCPPQHVGLGTGTQLGLAVAQALAAATGHDDMNATRLAECVGRGKRSALGIHGFNQGGLLVDGGKNLGIRIAPLLCRHVFPEDWAIVLVIPKGLEGPHGAREQDAFAHLGREIALRHTEGLCRVVLMGLLPALVERDLDAFGAALHEFNCRVGEMFRPWQGAVYSHPQVAAIVRYLRQSGLQGVGQSSWGPTVFAVVPRSRVESGDLRDLLGRAGLGHDEVFETRAANHGAIIREIVA
jgi:beta-ribofuranosylaminobenzene 5'-phosphate synthase